MASHYDCIGFGGADEDELEELFRRAADEATVLPCKKGTYLRWTCDTGAELWIQVSRRQELIGAHPHFNGDGACAVALTRSVARPGDSELDGAFHGWANPSRKHPDNGDYQLVFDAPDFHLHSTHLAYPARASVQLVAFGEEVTAFPSVEAYEASQGEKPGFAVESFIPAGLFSPKAGTTEPPTAHAIFTGRVLQSAEHTNSISHQPFVWAKVQTYRAVLDVVLAREAVTAGLAAGGVLQGTFWLSGRLTEYPRKQRLRLVDTLRGRR